MIQLKCKMMSVVSSKLSVVKVTEFEGRALHGQDWI